MEPDSTCECGDVLDEHSGTGECQVEGCPCACFELADNPEPSAEEHSGAENPSA